MIEERSRPCAELLQQDGQVGATDEDLAKLKREDSQRAPKFERTHPRGRCLRQCASAYADLDVSRFVDETSFRRGSSLGSISSTASRRSASADAKYDLFNFPDGSAFMFPSAWGVQDYINRTRFRFRMNCYRSLQPGETQADGESFIVPTGFHVEDVPLKFIEKPERCQPTRDGWFVDRERLFSVLDAMISGQPLPPVRVLYTDAGSRRVENGFHRYFASLALGYKEIPVLQQNVVKHANPSSSVSNEDCRQQDNPILIEDVTEKGVPIFLEATVLVRKREDIAKINRKKRDHIPAPSKPRWEPSAVREARLKREEQEREQVRRKNYLKHLSAQYAREIVSKTRLDEERCSTMAGYSGRPNMTYAEKALGRSKLGPPQSWEESPSLTSALKKTPKRQKNHEAGVW